MASAKIATPAQVREWGRQQPEFKDIASLAPGTKGRVNPKVAAAFNKTNKGKWVYSDQKQPARLTTLPVPNAAGAVRQTKVDATLARQVAQDLGYAGKRGLIAAAGLPAIGAAFYGFKG